MSLPSDPGGAPDPASKLPPLPNSAGGRTMNSPRRMSRARMAGALATVALSMVLSACSSGGAGPLLATGSNSPAPSVAPSVAASTATASPAGAPTLAAAWTRTSIAADGYSIDTPKDWSAVPIGGQDIDALIKQMQSSNPELAGVLQQARDSGQSFSFVALATDKTLIGTTGFAPNVNVIITPSQGYDSAFIAAANTIQLKKLTSVEGDIEDTAIALPADPGAHRLRYHLHFSASLTTVATLYLITHGGKTYNITLSAVDSQLAGLEDTFLTIARSITLLAP